VWEMSGTKDDGRCQKAVHIVAELCRKKSLPSLDLDTCREFLLLPSDQSLIISEPGTVGTLVLSARVVLVTANSRRKAGGFSQGMEMFASPVLDSGGEWSWHALLCGYFPLQMFCCEVLGASTTALVDAKWCSLMGTSAQRGQMGCYMLMRRWLMI